MTNMNDGITSFKFSQGPKAYKLKGDKVPVTPFLSLPSGDTRRRKGQKKRLGKLRVAADTKRTSRWPSEGWMVMAAPEVGLEDEAARRQHASKVAMPAYSDLTALPPALFLFRGLPTPAAQGDGPEK